MEQYKYSILLILLILLGGSVLILVISAIKYSISRRKTTTGKLKDYSFHISVETPYPVEDITEFTSLTGLNLKDTGAILNTFQNVGVSNLKDVNTLYKLGYIKFPLEFPTY